MQQLLCMSIIALLQFSFWKLILLWWSTCHTRQPFSTHLCEFFLAWGLCNWCCKWEFVSVLLLSRCISLHLHSCIGRIEKQIFLLEYCRMLFLKCYSDAQYEYKNHCVSRFWQLKFLSLSQETFSFTCFLISYSILILGHPLPNLYFTITFYLSVHRIKLKKPGWTQKRNIPNRLLLKNGNS